MNQLLLFSIVQLKFNSVDFYLLYVQERKPVVKDDDKAVKIRKDVNVSEPEEKKAKVTTEASC